MTSTATHPPETAGPRPRPAPPAGGGVTFPRTLHAEWIKFGSLRSSWAVLVTAVVGFLVIGLAIAYNTGRNRTGLAPEDTALSSTLQGYHLAELAIGVLGVLFVTGEYSTGMIRSTLAAVPARVPVLLAKALVLAAVALVVLTVTSVITFLVAQLVLGHYGHGWSLQDPTGWRVVLGTGLYLTLMALLASAFGWITRSTPGGICAFVGVSLLLPVLFGQLLGSWGRDVAEYLPGGAGQSFTTSLRVPQTLPPAAGLGVQAAWVLAALVVATVLLRRRDA